LAVFNFLVCFSCSVAAPPRCGFVKSWAVEAPQKLPAWDRLLEPKDTILSDRGRGTKKNSEILLVEAHDLSQSNFSCCAGWPPQSVLSKTVVRRFTLRCA
jgi:hypothetical protein